ncbi:MAG: transglycosylase domain-containing protein, partial [Kineosporiaceae bacterium]
MAGRKQPDPRDGQPPQWWNERAHPGPGPAAPTPETFFSQPGDAGPPAGPGRRPQGPAGPGRSGRRRLIDYPRSGRRGLRRWLPSWKLMLGGIGGVATALVIAFATFYALTPIPSVQDSDLPQTSLVFYSDGTQIGQFKKEQRTVVTLDKVPDHVQKAVLASEDRSFYSNRGVSPRGLIRAAWNNARGGSLQGGSTITQQYVKNFFLGSDRSIKRKAREFVISLKVAQQVPKGQILADYLNKIYFGRNAYGIQAAAQAYFRKDVGKLTVSEGAYLAGIINGPELYDPLDGVKSKIAATDRWRSVLVAMTEETWLTQADADAIVRAGLPPVQKAATRVDRSGQRGYLLDMVVAEAEKRANLTRQELETGGYMIRTTFDRKLIAKGVDAVDEVLGPRKKWPGGTQVGMATVRPSDGAVVAVYAGDDERARNAATLDQVQAGSTFKPFALIAALEGNPAKKGAEPLSLRSRFSGRSPLKIDEDPFEIKNFGRGNGAQYGQIDLLTATANSVNTVYVQLNERVSPRFTEATAVKAGLPKDTPGINQGNIANVLGSAAPHVLDMASAYGTIAAQGKHADPYMIASIHRIDDKSVVYTYKPKPTQVFEPSVMADASYAMQQVIRRGSGEYAQNLGRPAAGKTGTSSSNKSAWFCGFTPQYATAVAMFNVLKEGGGEGELTGWGPYAGREITGGSFPVRVWTTYMKAALDGVEVQQLPEPAYGGELVNPAPPPKPTPTEQPTPSGQPSVDPGLPPSVDPSGLPLPTDQPFPTASPLPPQPTLQPVPSAVLGS